jgi:hypothetical protein
LATSSSKLLLLQQFLLLGCYGTFQVFSTEVAVIDTRIFNKELGLRLTVLLK